MTDKSKGLGRTTIRHPLGQKPPNVRNKIGPDPDRAGLDKSPGDHGHEIRPEMPTFPTDRDLLD